MRFINDDMVHDITMSIIIQKHAWMAMDTAWMILDIAGIINTIPFVLLIQISWLK